MMPCVRVLIFHGYLLRGTGSNVYNARLAAALARAGHEVHLLCQDRDPPPLPAGVHVHCPDIGDVLPVYVADRYEGFDARPFPELSDEEIADYVERNVAAVRDVAGSVQPDVALANHLVMGPLVLARGLDAGTPYAVKIHGSALEYTVKPHPERFMEAAREGLAGAATILVGSRHTAESLWAAMDDPSLPARTRLGPPGVDVDEFRPRRPDEAAEGVRRLAARLAAEPAPSGDDTFARDPAAAAWALASLQPEEDPLVSFVGKLIVSKGVDLLAAAWPLVLQRAPQAKLVVVGFGAYRAGFERLLAALGAGDMDAVRDLAQQGRGAEGGPAAPLRHLLAFLDTVDDEYLEAAAGLPESVVLTGRLEHEDLADLLPACEAQIVPSTFPESFGMVAAEAAACGVLPVSAAHSGLAEVSAALAETLPPEARPWLSFAVGPEAVRDLAARVVAWLEAPADLRVAVRSSLVATARDRYSWDGVARGVIAAAEGRHDALAEVV